MQAALIDDIMSNILPEPDYDLWVAAPTTESLVYFQQFTSRLLVQCGNDLGEKMENLTDQLFSQGYDKVVLIGSDMPLTTSELLVEAIRHLDTCDCIVGPAADGGYFLIGMCRRIPEIFRGVDWSTDKVLRQTVQALDSVSLRHNQLPVYRDMDEWPDLVYYAYTEFAALIPNTSRWLKQHCL
ncbi:hypothetical protein GCM10025859_46760 [Alicyclobacillus fastidiosus]|nr:hypothetical protein GCM10025859_46760 [Alicyclobacillus fastidiosus]